ncbi:MAG: ABC transporter ATP-binding protein [Erysipelotrichaceae bacterium]|nr:ABC transporter ATP-binding protein [Erysipelotrichaceae bacterium]
MNNPILTIKNLSKTYYTKEKEILAINDLSLTINENSITAIVGPSGCGKSTLLNIIGNLEEKTSGKIIFNKNKIGYMFQNDCLFPWLTILDNCLLGLKIEKKLTKEKKEYVINLLTNYGLKDFIYSYPNNLSGGMRQRVALIRTLATSPDLLLLDEPFSALDFETRQLVSDDVYKIIKKEHKTTIIITHDIEEAIAIADTVIVLSSRPAKIKKIFNIQLTDAKTPTHNRTCKEFNDYYKKIWQVFDHEI